MNEKNTLLVVQFRTDDSSHHEQHIFGDEFSDRNVDLLFVNAITDDLTDDLLDGVDGVVLGGSGQFYLTDEHEWLDNAYGFVGHILEKDIPVLGICFGFQILGLHQGARIVRDESMWEAGTFGMIKTDAASKDSLLVNAPDKFLAILGHKETLVDIPNHLTILLKSEAVQCEAFRVDGKNAWGVLYHPEFNVHRFRDRLLLFPDYASTVENIDEYVAHHCKPAPHATETLHHFVDIIEGGF